MMTEKMADLSVIAMHCRSKHAVGYVKDLPAFYGIVLEEDDGLVIIAILI